MTTLILIRHGQTSANVDRLLDTEVPGAMLTELGHEQARALPERVRGHGLDAVQAVYASNLTRAQQTAEPLAEHAGVPVTVREGLREIDAGDYRMRGDELAAQAYVTAMFAWADGDLAACVPGGENGHSALGRFDEVIDEIRGSGDELVVAVSHGAMIRAWLAARAVNADIRELARQPLTNTGIAVLDLEHEIRLQTWMDAPVS